MGDDISILRIRFWYRAYDTAARIEHWTHREKIKPWHDVNRLCR